MTKLNKTLKDLFVDHDKCETMMYYECNYDPDYTYRPYDWKTKEHGDPIHSPIESGYAKELDEMGVDYTVETQYGGEDMGSEYYTVWKFTKGDETCYFKFNGWYQSYHGADFNEVFEVLPKEKTITVWE